MATLSKFWLHSAAQVALSGETLPTVFLGTWVDKPTAASLFGNAADGTQGAAQTSETPTFSSQAKSTNSDHALAQYVAKPFAASGSLPTGTYTVAFAASLTNATSTFLWAPRATVLLLDSTGAVKSTVFATALPTGAATGRTGTGELTAKGTFSLASTINFVAGDQLCLEVGYNVSNTSTSTNKTPTGSVFQDGTADQTAATDNTSATTAGSALLLPASVTVYDSKNNQRTVATSAAIKQTSGSTVATTGATKQTSTRTVASSASLKTISTRSVSTTGVFKLTGSRLVSTTSAIRWSRLITAVAALSLSSIRTVSGLSAIQKTSTRSISANAVYELTGSRSTPLSAILQKHSDRPVALSANFELTDIRSIPTTASLKLSSTRTVTTNGEFGPGSNHFDRTVGVLATLQWSRIVSANAPLQLTSQRLVSTTAPLEIHTDRSAPLTAALAIGNSVVVTWVQLIGPNPSIASYDRQVPVTGALELSSYRITPALFSSSENSSRTLAVSAVFISTTARLTPAATSILQRSIRSVPLTGIVSLTFIRLTPVNGVLVLIGTRSSPLNTSLSRISQRNVVTTARLLLRNSTRSVQATTNFTSGTESAVPLTASLDFAGIRTVAVTTNLYVLGARVVLAIAVLNVRDRWHLPIAAFLPDQPITATVTISQQITALAGINLLASATLDTHPLASGTTQTNQPASASTDIRTPGSGSLGFADQPSGTIVLGNQASATTLAAQQAVASVQATSIAIGIIIPGVPTGALFLLDTNPQATVTLQESASATILIDN